MIGQLPAHSRFAQAIADDEELAAETLYEEPVETPPPLSNWTPEVAELRAIREGIGIVAQLVAVLSRNRYVPPVPPRPETARRRLWLRANLARHRRHAAQLIPKPPEEVDGAVPG